MTEISTIRSEPAPRPPERAKPTRDTEQRFEDALARSQGEDVNGEAIAAPQDKPTTEPLPSMMLHGHAGQYRDDSDQRRASRGLDDGLVSGTGHSTAPPAESRASAVAPDAAPVPSGVTTLPASYVDMALRMALPPGFHGAETSLVMTDPRSIASHTIVSQDAAGTLSVDIGAQRDGSSEQQREELRARLEARGHRVARVDVRPVD